MLLRYSHSIMLLRKEEIIENYALSENELNFIIREKAIEYERNGELYEANFQKILPFIEDQDKRIERRLTQHSFKLEYPGGAITIMQQDAIAFLKTLPSNSIDVIATDPAYSGMNNRLQLGRGRIVGKYAEKGKNGEKWFEEFQDTEENYAHFLAECQRVLKTTTGHIYIMFDSFSLLTLGSLVRKYFDVKNLITWDKVNIGMGHYYRRRHEYILFATNSNNRKLRTRKFPDVWRFKRIHNAKYPTQKPVELFQTMFFASAESGFTVCDPFLGSGSSAIAAMKNNCNFVGCDLSEKAIETSTERIQSFLETGIDLLQNKSQAVEHNIYWE